MFHLKILFAETKSTFRSFNLDESLRQAIILRFYNFCRPISMIIEPILREPGSVSFSWMEIQRTKASLVQQIDQQTNFTANETLLEFGLYPKDGDCEHKCPDLDACIASVLWCDGNCLTL